MVVKTDVNQEKLNLAVDLMRALAHPLRLRILSFVNDNGEINVNKIYNTLKLEQSITSQHLRILRKVDLVKTRRDGKFIYYRINYDRIKHTNKLISEFFGV